MTTRISCANSPESRVRWRMRSASSCIISASFCFRHLLEIGRVIAAGKGVVATAGGGDPAVELAGPTAGVPLNIMCSRTCATPVRPFVSSMLPARYQTMCADRRRPPVLLDDDPQAIRQLVLERSRPDTARAQRGPAKGNQSRLTHGHESLLIEFREWSRYKCAGILPPPPAPERLSDTEVPCLVSSRNPPPAHATPAPAIAERRGAGATSWRSG
jgi:hypothetical protein